MQPLIIEAKEDTPRVILDKENQLFEISGRSLPEDILYFYNPIYDWLQEYISDPNEETIVNLKIDYFNSASHKAINQLLEMLLELKDIGKKIIINWHYLADDEDMYEAGTDFADLTGLKFEFKSYNI
jgi:hypothetical protein